MVEVAIRTEDPRATVRRMAAVLAANKAIAGEGGSGRAGSVDAAWRAWTLEDGSRVEIWSDNWTPLSLRGEAVTIDSVLALCELERADG